MGTDIHMIGESKNFSGYSAFTIPEKFQGRNYNFFAGLAGVRNGFGCAGCKRHQEVTPLVSEDFSKPEDTSSTVDLWLQEDHVISDAFGWTGDHSFGMCTLKQLKEYDWGQKIIAYGVLSLEEYEKWDKMSRPKNYSGGIMGKNIVTIEESELSGYVFEKDKKYYVQAAWEQPLVEVKFIDELLEHLAAYIEYDKTDEDVRIIFGFDS